MQIQSYYKSSIDGTIKYQLQTNDNYLIECCVIFFFDKEVPINICVSSQVGCECLCSFCVTGYKRFIRNLSSAEIENQVSLIFEANPDLVQYDFEVTYMGTGEPLLNKDNVLMSAKKISENFVRLKRINISSIFPEINIRSEEMALIKKPMHFQYSLHFLSDELRRKYFRKELAPINSVLATLNQLHKLTGISYCLNYILFDELNDLPQDAKQLVNLIRGFPTYVKISKYCPIEFSDLKPSSNFKQFTTILDSADIKWKAFESKGIDIQAACGHLLSDIQF